MEETINRKSLESKKEEDFLPLLYDIFRIFLKKWWLFAAIILLSGVIAFGINLKNYKPMYKASATFTVETYTNQNGYTFFYDNNTAQQMALTFPHLLDSNLLLDRVKTDLGTDYINGVPSAEVIENSNLFTITITSNSPRDAYDILLAFIDNYPSVSEYVVGHTQLNMIDMPQLPKEPYTEMTISESVFLVCIPVKYH